MSTGRVSLKQMLASMPMSSFKFLSFRKDVSSPDQDGKKIIYLTFELEEPLEKVVGSTLIFNPDGDDSVHPTVENVMEVKCNADLIFADEEKENPEFVFEVDGDGNPTKKGSYAGDLFLDVSRKDEVWLTDQKFRNFGLEARKGGLRERYQRFKK